MITIYKITNRQNLELYIGQTRQSIEQRFLQHSKSLIPLGEAMRQCGLEIFPILAGVEFFLGVRGTVGD